MNDSNNPYDSLWSISYVCEQMKQKNFVEYSRACHIAHIVGFLSGYVLPIICLFSFIINLSLIIMYIIYRKKMSRHMIYVIFICLSNIFSIIFIGCLVLFTAFGLPYIFDKSWFFFYAYLSHITCKMNRFLMNTIMAYSGNVLTLCSIDRSLMFWSPINFSKLTKKHVWFVCIMGLFVTSILMLPYTLLDNIVHFNNKTYCVYNQHPYVNIITPILIVNSGVLQTILIFAANLLFIIKLHKMLKKKLIFSKNECKHLKSTRIVLLLSLTYIICNLPNAIMRMFAHLIFTFHWSESRFINVHVVLKLIDITWNLYMWRTVFDSIIYCFYFKPFRNILDKFINYTKKIYK